MKVSREKVTKSVRFEVFKRDGFRCVYCGADPSMCVLQVDHVVAVANGGLNEPDNLVTACGTCNLGKSDTPLDRHQAKARGDLDPDAALDHAEQMRAFLQSQRAKADAQKQLIDELADFWADNDGGFYPADFDTRMPGLLREFGYDGMRRAIEIALGYRGKRTIQKWKLMYGVLRRWRETGERT